MAEWISVKDRLPGDGQEVIAAVRSFNGGLLINGKTVVTRFTEKFGFDFFPTRENAFLVDYWMPLPEPPKGE